MLIFGMGLRFAEHLFLFVACNKPRLGFVSGNGLNV